MSDCIGDALVREIAAFIGLGATIATMQNVPDDAQAADQGTAGPQPSTPPTAPLAAAPQATPAPNDGPPTQLSVDGGLTVESRDDLQDYGAESLRAGGASETVFVTPGQPGYGFDKYLMSWHIELGENGDWSQWSEIDGSRWPGLQYRFWESRDGDTVAIYCVDIKNDSSNSYSVYMYGYDYQGKPRNFNELQNYIVVRPGNNILASGTQISSAEAPFNRRTTRGLLMAPGGRFQTETKQLLGQRPLLRISVVR